MKHTQDKLWNVINDYMDNETGKVRYKELVQGIKGCDSLFGESGTRSERKSSRYSDFLSQIQQKTNTLPNDDFIVLDA